MRNFHALLLGLAVLLLAVPACDDVGVGQTDTGNDATDGGGEVAPDVAEEGGGDLPAEIDAVDDDVEPDADPVSNFECVGDVEFPEPEGENIDLDGVLLQFVTEVPMPDVAITVCAAGDFDCDTPIDTATSDAQGEFTVTVPAGDTGFAGYMQLEHEDLVPTLVFFWPPVVADEEAVAVTLVLTTESLDTVATVAGVTLDDERGHVGLEARDCSNLAAAGITLEASSLLADSDQIYFEDGELPVPTTEMTATAGNGFAGFFNLPPGPVRITGLAQVDDSSEALEVIGASNIFVRAGTLSEVFVGPSPRIAEDFACVGEFPAPVAQASEVDYTARMLELATREPIDGATVEACERDDADCSSPIATATTDEGGLFTITLDIEDDAGFDGYLEIAHDDLVPTILVPNPPIRVEQGYAAQALVVSENTWDLLVAASQVTEDAARGHVGLQAFDCVNGLASGVSFDVSTADEDSTPVYIVDNLPDTEATETDEFGVGGVFNVPVGTATITGSFDAAEYGSVDVPVRAGYLTEVVVAPAYRSSAEYLYIMIEDEDENASGGQPGADIDAVELAKGESSVYLAQISEAGFGAEQPTGANADFNNALGEPEGQCVGEAPPDWDAETFVSLGGQGGYLVGSFEALTAIETGDEIFVHACAGPSSETWRLSVGVGTSPTDPSWLELISAGIGVTSVTVPNLPLPPSN